ncbi:MAG: potassium-transporting ATPase subunit KdpC [Methanoregulaceae archaeon]|nr:potassium-transporting ATPase subunit KdpC [Methanoregulaceae archaeon]
MKSIRTACALFALLFIVTGIAYPLAVALIARVSFPEKAGGSLIREGRLVIGSQLIGQNFSGPEYFQGRPSSTTGIPDNASASGGSNLGPTNPELLDRVRSRITSLHSAGVDGAIPADLVMSSASGLDPHISLESAIIQVPVVAHARNLSEEQLMDLVNSEVVTDPLNPRYVNVLSLNMALDRLSGA